MTSRHRETVKKIYDGLSEEQKLNELMLKKLRQSILRGNKFQADSIAQATLILFPKSDVMVADVTFEALWKLGKHSQAIRIYRKVGRLFWHADTIGRYYERQGLMSNAVDEYLYQMNVYSKMGKRGILPLPCGPRELFFLGQWFSSRNKLKAQIYLELYLSAEEKYKGDSTLLRHKNAAIKILNKLKGSGVNGRTN